MRIGIVCYPTFGGSGVIATELGKALADNGHQVHFITYNQPARLDFCSTNLCYHEVDVSQYPLFHYPPYESALASKMVDVVRHACLDVLHVHYAIPHASAAFIAKQILASEGIQIPVITTLHGTDITLIGKDRTYQPVVAFSINQSDGVTAVSRSLKEATCQHFDIKKEIRVIPNFVDLARFNHQAKQHFKRAIAPEGERILIHTSNFRRVKRVKDVVKVFKQVYDKLPAKLLLVGDGPERSPVEELCRELGLADHVRFLGKQEAIEELLNVCDLFLLPSETESFGLAALEAMACHVPVISTNTGGLPEVNIEGESGFLLNVGDVDGMARKAIYILENDERLQIFKEAAMQRARQFSIDLVLPLYEGYYREVASHYPERVKECEEVASNQ